MEVQVVVALGAIGVAVVLAFLLIAASRRASSLTNSLRQAEGTAQSLRTRFAAVVDIEEAAAAASKAAKEEQAETTRALASAKAELEALRGKYAGGLARFKELEGTIRNLEEDLENIDVGLYRPHFTYEDAESYKAAVESVREQQKAMIKNGGATRCGTEWTVSGSRREGERMVRQTEKLILRAFNAESESAVANVSWNNHHVMEARINKAFEVLNKHGTVMQVSLTEPYRASRLQELRLVYEHAEKRREEREKQRRLRTEQREEERVQRELEREQEEAAREETLHAKALVKARAELAAARASERDAMQARIQQLEADLTAAQSRKERALAQAQLTKVGHVYIISNVGAFGDGIVKIGMTRRLDPDDRVRELGDASVPFPFDTHAMIYTENGPELEAKLHRHFWEQRLNWANDRKEFFKVDIPEIETALKKLGLEAELLKVPEAREYRETVAALANRATAAMPASGTTLERFPEDPFEPGGLPGAPGAAAMPRPAKPTKREQGA
jgi:uncharacterized protein DUF4041/Meiotically Up-regulated Gene 113 (MUG113) protein